jgi:uncharacterized Zn finger protein
VSLGKDSIRVTVCPWCGFSTLAKWPPYLTRCDGCGTKYSPIRVGKSGIKIEILVPAKSIALKNKNRNKLIQTQSETMHIRGHFAGFSYLKEASEQIAMCPWCGCSESNFKADLPGKNFECKECGTNYWSDWTWIMVPKRSIESRDNNVNYQASLSERDAHIRCVADDTLRWVVCPWCRNPMPKNRPTNMSECKECGTVFPSHITLSDVPKRAIEMKDKNVDKHIG